MTKLLGSGSRVLLTALVSAIVLAAPVVAGATSSSSGHHTVTKKKTPAKTTTKTKAKAKTQKQKLVIAEDLTGWWPKKDVQELHLSFGPIAIAPGQNNIKFDVIKQRPKVPGWIVSFKPQLVYASAGGACNGKPPRVDVVHLHHGVWLINSYPTYAAGEEKTAIYTPKGFGYQYNLTDNWALTYMIHDLTPNPTSVCLTYDIGFIPSTSAKAKGIIPVRTQWMDVRGISVYPVFDVHQGTGTAGRFTYPDQDPTAYPAGRKLNQWVVPQDETIVGMVGHLHPGGLYDSMWDTRLVDGQPKTVLLFRSRAHYFEPAGTVSWDVAMMGTPPNYRVAVKKGDVISVNGTYNSARASWYEAMAIMPMQVTNDAEGGLDPFTHDVTGPGVLNHGHLAENDNHGGGDAVLPDATKLADGPLIDAGQVPIDNFIYGKGDLTLTGMNGRPPVVHQGQSLTFVNDDAPIGPGEWHTITSCRAPCNAATGIAYPVADQAPGTRSFDSGELGIAGPPTAGRITWSTPPDLPKGTYTYFCRVHPFMRGSFRVIAAQ